MPVFKLDQNIWFPPIEYAEKDGLLAVGGDLSEERLLLAYRSGIFPWFDEEDPILWWSPNPRFVLYPENLKVSGSMKSVLRKEIFSITFNQNFEEVIANCSNAKRKDQNGTWITKEMMSAYVALHHSGFAKSVEVWQGDLLVGGMYGIELGNCFFGESMFSLVSNASKVALITLTKNHSYKLIDCQVYTAHLEGLGAEMISRQKFMKEILNY